MSHPTGFKLSARGILLAAISAAFANAAFANSGRVDFTAGNVTVTNADGTARPLTKGNEVKTGDRIVSDTNGRAQIRFSDGSYVSLQPNTDFDIKNYVFNGESDGTEKAFFGMLKGAMRTVTGLVGRKNRNAYQLATPTATIGIRGTGGVISVGTDGSTLVQGTSGVWTLTTGGGSVEVPAGKAGAATSSNQAPQQTSRGPDVPAPGTGTQQEQPKFGSGENRDSTGSQSVVSTFKPLVSGSGYAIAYAGAEGGTNSNLVASPRNAVFSSSGLLTKFDGSVGVYTLGGSHAEFATADGVLAWGRWIGPFTESGGYGQSATLTANQGLHYVVGTPTPYASLPTGVTYTYNLLGATSPTAADGSVAPGTLSSASLTGNFITNTVAVSFAGSIGSKNFNSTVSGMSIQNSGGGATFSGNGSYSGTLQSEGTASVKGFLAGSAASHAAFSYQMTSTSLTSGSNVNGAVALKR